MNNRIHSLLAFMLLTTLNCQALTPASTAVAHTPGSSQTLRHKSAHKTPRKTPAMKARDAFDSGYANTYTPDQLVHAGVFKSAPLIGGTYPRQQAVKYIVLHSTETATPADALRVVRSWNNRGKSHPGAQYLVDRDGAIYQTVCPENTATMHVNAFKTKYGVNNRNSIGIEIVRAGKQRYTDKQLKSLTRLCLYLQKRFEVGDDKIVAHGYVQPSDRRDPVDFNWHAFSASKSMLSMVASAKLKEARSVAIADGARPPAKLNRG